MVVISTAASCAGRPGPGEKIVVAEIDLDTLRAARPTATRPQSMPTYAGGLFGRPPRIPRRFVGAKDPKGDRTSRKTNRQFDGSLVRLASPWIVIHPGVSRTKSRPSALRTSRLARTILEAAVLPAGNASGLDVKTLAPWTNFMCAVRDATLELARAVALTPSDRVPTWDVVWAGRPMLGVAFGCQVVGIDLTADYVKTAGHLAAHFGLNHRVRYECADALALPFREAEFDVVWTQHAGDEHADKAGLYARCYGCSKPGRALGALRHF